MSNIALVRHAKMDGFQGTTVLPLQFLYTE